MHDYMDVIACNSVPVHRHTISLRRDSKPLPVGIPFLHELQEKTTIMTAVCEMIGVPLNQMEWPFFQLNIMPCNVLPCNVLPWLIHDQSSMSLLGIDLGTTDCNAGVFALDGSPLRFR